MNFSDRRHWKEKGNGISLYEWKEIAENQNIKI